MLKRTVKLHSASTSIDKSSSTRSAVRPCCRSPTLLRSKLKWLNSWQALLRPFIRCLSWKTRARKVFSRSRDSALTLVNLITLWLVSKNGSFRTNSILGSSALRSMRFLLLWQNMNWSSPSVLIVTQAYTTQSRLLQKKSEYRYQSGAPTRSLSWIALGRTRPSGHLKLFSIRVRGSCRSTRSALKYWPLSVTSSTL